MYVAQSLAAHAELAQAQFPLQSAYYTISVQSQSFVTVKAWNDREIIAKSKIYVFILILYY